MEQPEENKPRRNWAAIIVGLFFAVWGLLAICTGSITAGKRHSHTYYVAQDPHGFWLMVAVTFGIAAISLFFGFTGRK
jgi:hypothetical protein